MISEEKAKQNLAEAEKALGALVAEYNGWGQQIAQMQQQQNAVATRLVEARERVKVLRETLGIEEQPPVPPPAAAPRQGSPPRRRPARKK